MGNGALEGAVIAVAGAGGPAGRAALLRLAEAGAVVVGSDNDPERLAAAVDAARYAHGGATVTGETVDLLDLESTRDWAVRTEKEFGRVDGLVHLVGGWRGSETFTKTSLDDWDFLELLLVRTVQHTTLAFHEALQRSDRGRYVLISAAGRDEADRRQRRVRGRQGGRRGVDAGHGRLLPQGRGRAGADVGCCHPGGEGVGARRDARRPPNAKFAGFTDVKDLAESIVGVWDQPAAEVNGKRLWLTEKP